MLRALAVIVATVTVAGAQPCPRCDRGDELIAKFKLDAVRTHARELATLELGEPLSREQFAKVVALRRRSPELARLGVLDDPELAAVAAALCRATPTLDCNLFTTQALRCLADRCVVDVPSERAPLVDDDEKCEPPSLAPATRSQTPFGLGFEWGTGWLSSRYPTDGRAWSAGIEARLRLSPRFGTIARIDRIAARDGATDTDNDGEDDLSTGEITRVTALGGPSIVFDTLRDHGTLRFLRLDLLGGYLSTRSQANESGPAAGFDLAYQWSAIRFGARVVQGFGDARDATMILGHLGLVAGSLPPVDYADCKEPRMSRLALGFQIPAIGYGFSSELGIHTLGFGVLATWHLTRRLDALAQADLLIFPGIDQDRVIHQAGLAGVRINLMEYAEETGFLSTIAAGYTHGAGLLPRAGSGPITDASIGYGMQTAGFAVYVSLHSRLGLAPDNSDYRALFLTSTFEMRIDRRGWRDRGLFPED